MVVVVVVVVGIGIIFVVGVVGGMFVLEEGAGEVGEEGGVEVAEPEEGFLEGVAPLLGEELGGVGGGGGVEGVVVGLEVLVEHLDVGGENGEGVAGDGVAEEGEVVVLEGVEPLCVVLLEGPRLLLVATAEEWRHGFQHFSSWRESCFSEVQQRLWFLARDSEGLFIYLKVEFP